jgi:YihY family inner membrane protein
MQLVNRIRDGLDRRAARHAWLGFPLAVFKKFGEDRAGQLAALIAYYSFFSIFPLMLVFVTVLGLVLGGHAQLQDRIVGSALAQFPIIGDQIRENVHSLNGSGVALAIGIAGALWAGLGGVKAAENAMDTVWNVPRKDQPNFVKATLRALVMLAVLGAFSLAATALAGLGAGGTHAAPALKIAGIAASALLNVIVFTLAYKILTVANIKTRDVLTGAVVAGIAWTVLQSLGSYYVGHQLKNASQTYGFFAVVIGLLSWLYLGAQITLLCAEVNVVRAKRLWPRAIGEHLRDADVAALTHEARVEQRHRDERIAVRFGSQSKGEQDPSTPSPRRDPGREKAPVRRAVLLAALAYAAWRRIKNRTTTA